MVGGKTVGGFSLKYGTFTYDIKYFLDFGLYSGDFVDIFKNLSPKLSKKAPG